MSHPFLLSVVADALLAGKPDSDLLLDRLKRVFGGSWRWLRPLCQRYLKQFGADERPRHREVVAFLGSDVGLQRALARYSDVIPGAGWLGLPRTMFPGAERWGLPALETPGDLAKWLGLDPGELRWFADLKALGYKHNAPKLGHYHYRVIRKRFGAVRLIEAPKARLKDRQRQILMWILDKVPPHPAAHGFVKGRSIRTFVRPHVGQRVVLRMDLRDFFPTFGGVRIQNLFRTLGYPEAVADLLGGVCTNQTPLVVWDDMENEFGAANTREVRQVYSRPHLPQGAPTSPALANISFYRMDCRLEALAKCRGGSYTRYADDLAFSGGREFERGVERFGVHVGAILDEEGFRVNHRKTRIMRQGVRQHLGGLVANDKMNVPRHSFEHLKAILTNCVHFGAKSQNRENLPNFRAHLEGRVAFVESINPEKGKRLRTLIQRIRWAG